MFLLTVYVSSFEYLVLENEDFSHLHEYYKLKLSLSLIEQLKMVIRRAFFACATTEELNFVFIKSLSLRKPLETELLPPSWERASASERERR